MTIDEAQQLWEAQPTGAELPEEMIREIEKQSNRLSRAILYRDIREWAATLVLFAVFFIAGLFPGAPSAWFFGAAFVALFPGCYLLASRLKSPARPATFSNYEFLKYAHRKYSRQERLLSGVVTWYLTPLFLSALLFIAGTVLNIPDFTWQLRLALLIIQLGICLVVFTFVAWLNIRAARIRLRPKRMKLEAILHGLREQERCD